MATMSEQHRILIQNYFITNSAPQRVQEVRQFALLHISNVSNLFIQYVSFKSLPILS
jgi:5-bromo-4-chloroindolyl phosphate hydrolysis protein